MGKRILGPLIAGMTIAALVLLVRANPGVLHGPALREGSNSPEVWSRHAGSEALVGWTFRTRDCLSCSAPTSRLRQLQRKFGPRVVIAAVGVDADSEVVEPFLRNERLDVELTYLSEAEYRKQFGSTPLPALYLVQAGRIVAVDMGDRDEGSGGTVTLESTISRLLEQ